MEKSEKEGRKSVFHYDLHVHSKYSADCKSEPKVIIKTAEKMGLKGIAITDHDTVKFHKRVKIETGILIVPGIEISTEGGHVIGLGVRENIQKRMTLEETVEKIREEGGEVVMAHPYDFMRKGVGKRMEKLQNVIIETQNGATFIQKFNEKAKQYAQKNKLGETGGSDAHRIKDIGMAYTRVGEKVETVEELLEKIRKRETKGEGKHLSLKEKIIRTFQIH